MKFKIGDRVRMVSHGGFSFPLQKGTVKEIVSYNMVEVCLDEEGLTSENKGWCFYNDELELIEPENPADMVFITNGKEKQRWCSNGDVWYYDKGSNTSTLVSNNVNSYYYSGSIEEAIEKHSQAGIEHTQQEVPDTVYEQELGAKFDQGKPRVDILAKGCPRALLAVGEALGYGAKKYNESPDNLNFLQVEDGFNRYSRAMMGHFLEESINPVDEDSGLDHIVLTAVNALFRLELYLRGKENDQSK